MPQTPFHPIVEACFKERFGEPTEPQRLAPAALEAEGFVLQGRFTDAATKSGAEPDWSALSDRASRLFRAGRYAEAVQAGDEAVKAAEGDAERTDRLFREALAVREKAFGRDHPQIKNIAKSRAEFLKTRGAP